MRDYKYVVFTNCKPGTDAEFNNWYDEVHLRDVLAVPGFIGASRSRVFSDSGTEPRYRYMAIYDIRADDVDAAITDLKQRAGSEKMAMSDTLEENVELVLCENITPYRLA